MKKINLGCGKDIKNGWENYDMFPMDERVKYVNLGNLPLPFDDNYADEILLSHVLEHIQDRKMFMLEISRILKPDGICRIVLPSYSFSMDHKSYIHTKDYLATVCRGLVENDEMGHFCPRPFKVIEFKRNNIGFKGTIRNIVQWIKILGSSNIHYKIINEKKVKNPKER